MTASVGQASGLPRIVRWMRLMLRPLPDGRGSVDSLGDRAATVRERSFGRLACGVAWNALGSAVAQGGSFVSSIVVARILGKEAFGQFAMIQSTVVALSVLAGLGLGITATKFVSEYRASQPEKLGRILGLSSMVAWLGAVCFAIGVAVAGPAVAGSLAEATRISTIYILFIAANAYQLGALAGFEAFRSIARIGVVYGAANVLLTWSFAQWWGLNGAVLSQGVAAFLLWSLYQWALRKECRARNIHVRYRGVWQERKTLFGFSIPAASCGMVAVVAVWWCNANLVRNAGFGELAVFNAVNSMRSMILFVPALVSRVATPMLNHMKANGDEAGYRRTFRTALAANGGIALILATTLAVAGGRILGLFGKNFDSSRALLILLMASVVLEVIANNLFQKLFTEGRLWRHLAIVCIWTTILVAAATVATPRYGAAGLALAYLAAWSVSASLYGVEARRA